MKASLSLLLLFLILVSCQSSDTGPFRKMTEEELVAYNLTVPLGENVYCFEGVRTGSHIRKRRCLTLREIVNQVNDTSHALGVLNYGGQSVFGYRPSIGVD